VGWLAFSLAPILAVLLWQFPPSISATYYTRACPVFMIILGVSSVLLMYYDGYDKVDSILNTIAGFFGIFICLFPCGADFDKVGVFNCTVEISSTIHNISAVVFFAILSYVTLFQFTKSNGNMTEKKKKRNVIYRVCGVGMVSSFALFLLPDFYFKI
jgi:hypothetical protein